MATTTNNKTTTKVTPTKKKTTTRGKGKRKSSIQKVDLYQMVTDKMIALLEQGKIPWHCPWSKYGMAKNYATNRHYSGINALWMNLTEHPIPYFMSFKQIKERGGNIKKGATSEMVFFFKSYYKNANGERISQAEYQSLIDQGAEAERIAFLKYYRVFNIADVEGIEIEIPQVELQEHEPIKRCEQLIERYEDAPEKIFRDANKAYYDPIDDQLNMPDMAQFESAESYYSVYFHELIHSTGHKKRLAREGITELNLFGEANYSKE